MAWCEQEEHKHGMRLLEHLMQLVEDGAEPEQVVSALITEKTRRLKALAQSARDQALVHRLEKGRWR
jgi:hypothetical protein